MATSSTMVWPADRPERRTLARLKPFERNARLHSPEQVLQLRRAIDHWGWTMPVLIDERDEIIAGHGRVLAAGLDMTAHGGGPPFDDAPVIVARGWTDEQVKAYRLADNKLALNASWDADLLRIEVGELQAMTFDVALLGFGEGELAQLMADGNFAPGSEADQGRLDQLEPKIVTCPHCHQAFDLRHVKA